jgi:hypothetical protein
MANLQKVAKGVLITTNAGRQESPHYLWLLVIRLSFLVTFYDNDVWPFLTKSLTFLWI